MLKKQMDADVALNTKTKIRRFISTFLGITLCGFLFVPFAASEVTRISTANVGTVEGVVQRVQVRREFKTRRDPFAPIINPRAISSSSKKSHPGRPTIPPISIIKDPKLKLLGIISGQYVRQAVIQVSPGKRIFVRPGQELVQSGWSVKAISEGEVLLEHLSTSSSGKGLSQSRTFILSFPTPGKLR